MCLAPWHLVLRLAARLLQPTQLLFCTISQLSAPALVLVWINLNFPYSSEMHFNYAPPRLSYFLLLQGLELANQEL